jgi:hypothetical protein
MKDRSFSISYEIRGWSRMIFVCREHVTNGLKEIEAPHIEQAAYDFNHCCKFCQKSAQYRLFSFEEASAAVAQ